MNLQKLSKEDQLKIFKILCVVLIVCLIVVSLGLGLGLGLKHQSAPTEEKGEPSWLEDQCEEIKTPECPTGFSRPPLILISLDGFRAGYLKSWANFLPVIEKLRTCGTHSKYMRAMYPTKTFPNHYTIVTGLYAETHGIVDNNMYDYVFKKSFSLSGDEKSNPEWWGGQPIWLTAMYQNLKAGTFFWPGSDVKINGTYPDKYEKFNSSIPYEERVRTVLKWLSLPESERPEFYTLYFDEPDHAGHNSGPDSGEVVEALQLVDRIVGMLMDELKKRNLHKCVNLIIVADHGMENTYCDQTEYMTNYFDSVKNLYVYSGPAARIRAKNVPADYLKFDAEGTVKNLSCRYSKQHFIPYMAYELPKRFHYANNRRINKEVHLYLDKQWQAARDKSYNFCGGGNHGYDNEYKSMHAIFIGNGPGFKFKTEVGPFDNIELYNLMCDMLQITPSPNNGTHGSLNHLLKNPPKSPTLPAEVSALSSCPLSTLNPSDHLGCSCENSTLNIKEMNKNINLTAEQVKTAEAVSMPYGRPRVLQRNRKYCLLTHNSYTNGYNSDILMPLWSAYNVNKSQGQSVLPPVIPNCLRADPRISAITSQRCSYYNTTSSIGYEFLYPPNMVTGNQQYDALITSNLVPMYQAFKQIWHYLHDTMLLKEAAARNGVNVMSGPVFDYNYDGHFDTPEEIKMHVNDTSIPIPTHFYVILTNCNNTAQTPLSCVGPLSVRSFILPHRPDNSESCPMEKRYPQWIEERIWAHTARVRDVELITGLDFYQDRKQPVIEILQLKTYLPEFTPHV